VRLRLRHRLLLFALLAAGVFIHCAPSPRAPAPPPAGTPTLRVMTFNVNFGVSTAPENVAAIRDSGVDVVLLQETTAETEAVFRRELADLYPHMRFRECCRAGGLGILSRHPIVDEQWIDSQLGWFPAWRFVVDAPIGEVQLLDVHLRPPVSDSGSWVAGYVSTGPFRRQEIEAFWSNVRADLPTIVAGDFNENERGDAIDWLEARGFTSVLPMFEQSAVTWEWPLPLATLRARLDHIIVGPGLSAHAAAVIEAGRSDHFPVVAELSAKAR
jgi:endonuclease/exonuclease/phosphatase family metal-dependent hydrolase